MLEFNSKGRRRQQTDDPAQSSWAERDSFFLAERSAFLFCSGFQWGWDGIRQPTLGSANCFTKVQVLIASRKILPGPSESPFTNFQSGASCYTKLAILWLLRVVYMGKQQSMTQVREPMYPCGRLGWNSGLLAVAKFSPDCFEPFGEWASRWFVFFSLPW